MKRKLYLSYGSNMNIEQMAYRCPAAETAGITELTGYRLLFRGANGGAVATVERFKGGSVPVLLWRITPEDEAALDSYEGWPRLYRKETVRVKLDGKWTSAMVYVMNGGRPLGLPNRYYYDVIRQGYASAGLDTTALYRALRDSTNKEIE